MTKGKKLAIFGSIFTIVSSSIIVPITYFTILNNSINTITTKYLFDNQVFNNKNELFNYAKSIVQKNKYDIVNREKWSINYNNNVIYFSNVNDLFNFLNNKIIIHNASTSKKININYDESINDNELFDLNLDKNINKINIFRGNNDTLFISEIEAKNSFLEMHDTYLYNDIFFRTKEELKAYLELNYDSIQNNNNKNIVIVSPNNDKSQPINLDNLKNQNENEIDKFTSFINLYSNKYLEIELINPLNKKEYNYFNYMDIINNQSNILSNFDNPSYININSNQGFSNYLIDLNVNDNANLYGPYYTKGTSSLKNIANPDAWTRIEGTSWNFNDNESTAQLLSSFMDLIIYEDNNFPYPFGIEELKNNTKQYFDFLKGNYSYVYDSVMNLYKTMKTGKRYSSFYKLPILFIKTIQDLVFISADQNIIDMTISYYKKIAKSFDKRLYAIVPSIFLEPKVDGQYKKFSFVDLFKIGNKNFDFNTDIESFVDIVIDEYSNFVEFINFISAPIFFGTYFPNIFDYNESLVVYINPKYYFNFAKFKNEFSNVWKLFNSSNVDELEQILLSNYKTNTNDTLDNSTLSYLISQISLTKEFFNKNVLNNIKHSINQFLSGNYTGYESFFNGLSNNAIQSFINLYKYNNNQIDYRIFSLIKILSMLNFNNRYINFSFSPFIYSENVVSSLQDKIIKYFNFHYKSFIDNIISNWTGINILLNLLVNDYINFDDKWIQIVNSSKDLFDNLMSATKSIFEIMEKDPSNFNISDVMDEFKVFCSVIPYIEVVSIILDFITPKKTKFSYVFETEGNKYIWDGGKETSYLFGLVTVSNSSIDDMKINNPIEVTRKNIENGYYYNGKIYSDLDTLKRNQLYDILNGRFTSENSGINTIYSFDKLDGKKFLEKQGWKSIGVLDYHNDDLIDYVYNSIISNDKKYIIDNVYTFANGYTLDFNLSMQKNIENIVSNIRPTKVSMLPELDKNNFPIIGNALRPYKLPGTSWTSMNGFQVNSLDNYIIVDSNVLNQQDFDSISILKKSFYDKFDVQYKTILESDLYKYSNFSEYQNNINYFNVYEVILDNGYRKFFQDKSDALKWFLQQCNFKVYNSIDQVVEYYYDNNIFYDLNSYLAWILKNSEVVNA